MPDTHGLVRGDDGARRCGWSTSTPDYTAYHDDEWGRPVVDDVRIYEKLSLEGFQSGLSWLTILRKREGFRRSFANFDPEKVARFGTPEVERLLADTSIVRHRGKIEATIANARATIAVQSEHGSLAALVWSFEPGRRRAAPKRLDDIAATTPESVALSKALKRFGFRFVARRPPTRRCSRSVWSTTTWPAATCDAAARTTVAPRSCPRSPTGSSGRPRGSSP